MTVTRILPCLALVVGIVAASAQERPLPDAETFLREVRARLQPDVARQSSYMYVETRRTRKLDGKGRSVRENVEEIESYPGLPGEQRWERVVRRNGSAVPSRELEKADRDRQKHVEAYARRLSGETPTAKTKRLTKGEEQRAEARALVDDVFLSFDIALLGRETIDGHQTVRVSLTPRPSARARTREGRFLKHFRGYAWLSESEYELVKLEVEAIDTVSFGLGMARVHRGTSLAFERRQVSGEAWLPFKSEYRLSARVLLLKRLREAGDSSFFGYRKFGVATDSTFAPP